MKANDSRKYRTRVLPNQISIDSLQPSSLPDVNEECESVVSVLDNIRADRLLNARDESVRYIDSVRKEVT